MGCEYFGTFPCGNDAEFTVAVDDLLVRETCREHLTDCVDSAVARKRSHVDTADLPVQVDRF